MRLSAASSDVIIWIVSLTLLVTTLAVQGGGQDGEDPDQGSGMGEYSGDDENTSQMPGDARKGSADFPIKSRSLTVCQRQRSDASKQPGSFRPQCLPGGSFKPIQCHGSTGECWCVDSHGEEIPGTIQRAPYSPKCSQSSSIEESREVAVTRQPLDRIPERQTDVDDIIIVESSTIVATEPVVTDQRNRKPVPPNNVNEEDDRNEDEENEEVDDETTEVYNKSSFLSLFKDPLIFAGIVGGAVLAILVIVSLIMFTIYRMRKKDEGSYDLGKQGKTYPFGYTRAKDQEFFA